jgi:hypothetical protein
MKRFVHLFLASLALLMMSGCERLPSVNSLVMTTPDAGNLTFSTHVFADDGSDLYDVIAFTGGKKVSDVITLFFLFDKKTSVGEEIALQNCHFGLSLSSNSEDYASELTSGHIYLKDKSSNRLILQFKDACFTTVRGEYRLSGNLILTPTDN